MDIESALLRFVGYSAFCGVIGDCFGYIGTGIVCGMVLGSIRILYEWKYR